MCEPKSGGGEDLLPPPLESGGRAPPPPCSYAYAIYLLIGMPEGWSVSVLLSYKRCTVNTLTIAKAGDWSRFPIKIWAGSQTVHD